MKLAHYWDTMGWIKFQQDKMEDAEKYLFAAWQVADDPTIGMHLGRVYEALKRRTMRLRCISSHWRKFLRTRDERRG